MDKSILIYLSYISAGAFIYKRICNNFHSFDIVFVSVYRLVLRDCLLFVHFVYDTFTPMCIPVFFISFGYKCNFSVTLPSDKCRLLKKFVNFFQGDPLKRFIIVIIITAFLFKAVVFLFYIKVYNLNMFIDKYCTIYPYIYNSRIIVKSQCFFKIFLARYCSFHYFATFVAQAMHL